jgi:hypothetical protein
MLFFFAHVNILLIKDRISVVPIWSATICRNAVLCQGSNGQIRKAKRRALPFYDILEIKRA